MEIVGEAEDEEYCWVDLPHPSHMWASQVLDREEDSYVLLVCPGQ